MTVDALPKMEQTPSSLDAQNGSNRLEHHITSSHHMEKTDAGPLYPRNHTKIVDCTTLGIVTL